MDILELQRQHNDQKLLFALEQAKRKVKQETLSSAISLIASQIEGNTMALFFTGLKASK